MLVFFTLLGLQARRSTSSPPWCRWRCCARSASPQPARAAGAASRTSAASPWPAVRARLAARAAGFTSKVPRRSRRVLAGRSPSAGAGPRSSGARSPSPRDGREAGRRSRARRCWRPALGFLLLEPLEPCGEARSSRVRSPTLIPPGREGRLRSRHSAPACRSTSAARCRCSAAPPDELTSNYVVASVHRFGGGENLVPPRALRTILASGEPVLRRHPARQARVSSPSFPTTRSGPSTPTQRSVLLRQRLARCAASTEWSARSRRRDPTRCSARMGAALAHRGPDGDGRASHRRRQRSAAGASRSSTSPAGAQPLANETATCIAVCNGEIYNHVRAARRARRRAGIASGPAATPRCIPHLYEEHGTGLRARARRDVRRRDVGRASPPPRPRPRPHGREAALPCATRGRRLCFASEPKALLRAGDVGGRARLAGARRRTCAAATSPAPRARSPAIAEAAAGRPAGRRRRAPARSTATGRCAAAAPPRRSTSTWTRAAQRARRSSRAR